MRFWFSFNETFILFPYCVSVWHIPWSESNHVSIKVSGGGCLCCSGCIWISQISLELPFIDRLAELPIGALHLWISVFWYAALSRFFPYCITAFRNELSFIQNIVLVVAVVSAVINQWAVSFAISDLRRKGFLAQKFTAYAIHHSIFLIFIASIILGDKSSNSCPSKRFQNA